MSDAPKLESRRPSWPPLSLLGGCERSPVRAPLVLSSCIGGPQGARGGAGGGGGRRGRDGAGPACGTGRGRRGAGSGLQVQQGGAAARRRAALLCLSAPFSSRRAANGFSVKALKAG